MKLEVPKVMEEYLEELKKEEAPPTGDIYDHALKFITEYYKDKMSQTIEKTERAYNFK